MLTRWINTWPTLNTARYWQEDKQGNQRKTTEIIANNVEFLTRPENGVSQQQARPAPSNNYSDEEIPF
jgi:single-stranded DNA-binding protein